MIPCRGGICLDFVFKELSDAIWLHEYFIKKNQTITFYETTFQNQKQYILTIDNHKVPIQEIQSGFIQFILIKKRMDWARDILKEYFYYKEESEQDNILDIVTEMFDGERPELMKMVGVMNDEVMIREAILSLFDDHKSISFDSLIKFRLKKYFEQLIQYVEMAIDEYKMEQEYQVFIQMLRDYLANRKACMDTVRIYFGEYGKFYSKEYQELSKEQISEMIDRRLITNHPVYIDSVTIAPLLSIAPKKIYLYADSADNGLIRTIQNIFEERVILLEKEQFWKEKNRYPINH